MKLIEVQRDKICNFCAHSEYRDPNTQRRFYRMQGTTQLAVMVCSVCLMELIAKAQSVVVGGNDTHHDGCR